MPRNNSKLTIQFIGAIILSVVVNFWVHKTGFDEFQSLVISTLCFIAALLVIICEVVSILKKRLEKCTIQKLKSSVRDEIHSALVFVRYYKPDNIYQNA